MLMLVYAYFGMLITDEDDMMDKGDDEDVRMRTRT